LKVERERGQQTEKLLHLFLIHSIQQAFLSFGRFHPLHWILTIIPCRSANTFPFLGVLMLCALCLMSCALFGFCRTNTRFKGQKSLETIVVSRFSCDGGDEEDRTLDLTDANRTLSQLSYAPIFTFSERS
jgi:hypothetical protein